MSCVYLSTPHTYLISCHFSGVTSRLLDAVSRGNIDIIEQAIREGDDIDIANVNGW